MKPPALPSREGVEIDQFGDVTVPAKPRSWSMRRYLETYDEDRITVWVLHADGARAVFTVRGPLSARALIHGLRSGSLHLVHWGRYPEGKPVFPVELLERARG